MSINRLALAALGVMACAARAADFDLDLDVRLLTSDGSRSFLDGGLGELRFGEDKSGLQLGRARFALAQTIGEVWCLRLDASAWDNNDKNLIDLTEAYLEYRPYPRAGFRARIKGGAFYAPISLENREGGWGSPYTVSSSALNTWIGEELRTIGLEGQLEWLGTRMGHNIDLGLTAALYGWNDPAGGVVASHGFALHDRQTTLFGRVGPRGVPPLYGRELFHDIDGRPGMYAGIEARYLDRLVLRALHYDNRGDPTAFDAELMDFAWETRFDSAGLRLETAAGWTAIVQWLDGETYIDPGFRIEWPLEARFALLSKSNGPHMLSVRYDDFAVGSNLPDGSGVQSGHAWIAAYVFEHDPHWRFTLEWLRVTTHLVNRTIYLGEPPLATESQLQFAARYKLH
jgi:hypothetical protein